LDPRELIPFAYASLKDRKLRSTLTILGLTIGPAVIVALVGAVQGFSDAIAGQFSKIGATTILVMPSARGFTISQKDVEALRSVAHVTDVIPFFSTTVAVKYGSTSKPVQLFAMDVSKLPKLAPGVTTAQGRLPSSYDLVGAVVGFNLANPKNPEERPFRLNQVISTTVPQSKGVQARSFLVVGTLERFGQGMFINPDDTIFVSLSAGQAILKTSYYSGVLVIASAPEHVNSVLDGIDAIYGDKVRVVAVSSVLAVINSVTQGVTMVLGTVASISVIVAFVGIMTTMFTAVVERTKEIGLLKALGFKDSDVTLLFLTEAALVGLIGGLIGSTGGIGLSYAIVAIMRGGVFGGQVRNNIRGLGGTSTEAGQGFATFDFSPVISPELFLQAILMSVVVGALAGLIPARRAAKLDPVVALRQE